MLDICESMRGAVSAGDCVKGVRVVFGKVVACLYKSIVKRDFEVDGEGCGRCRVAKYLIIYTKVLPDRIGQEADG